MLTIYSISLLLIHVLNWLRILVVFCQVVKWLLTTTMHLEDIFPKVHYELVVIGSSLHWVY